MLMHRDAKEEERHGHDKKGSFERSHEKKKKSHYMTCWRPVTKPLENQKGFHQKKGMHTQRWSSCIMSSIEKRLPGQSFGTRWFLPPSFRWRNHVGMVWFACRSQSMPSAPPPARTRRRTQLPPHQNKSSCLRGLLRSQSMKRSWTQVAGGLVCLPCSCGTFQGRASERGKGGRRVLCRMAGIVPIHMRAPKCRWSIDTIHVYTS